MANHTAAGATRKSHKSRKTEPQEPVTESSAAMVGGPSSTALATVGAPASNPPARRDETPAGEPGVAVQPFVEPEPKKQWWFRAPDSKTRKQAEKIAVMDLAGHKDAAIAKKLGTTEGTVRVTRYIALKNGWTRRNEDGEPEIVDVEAELAYDIDRKVVRNLSASLDGQMTNWQTHETTLAAAKGRGMFKTHEVAKNESPQALPVVAIQVIMPPIGAGDQLPQVDEASMGGVPAFAEGETIEGESAE